MASLDMKTLIRHWHRFQKVETFNNLWTILLWITMHYLRVKTMNILCQLITINYENLEVHFWSFWQTKIFQIQAYIWCLSSFLFPQYCRSWPSLPQRAWPFVICLYGLSPFQNFLFSIYNFSNRNPFSIENDELKVFLPLQKRRTARQVGTELILKSPREILS